MRAWMRVLGVILTSTKHKLRVSYGFNEIDNLTIDISGTKYLSSLKDNFSVVINNLTYSDVIKLVDNKFNEIEILCGYKNAGIRCIFSGSILNISNNIVDGTTNSMIFVCASKALGNWSNRLNLSLNSGLNMWTACSIICKQAGIRNPKISPYLKNRLLTETLNASGSGANIIDMICRNDNNLIVQSDASLGAGISIWDPNRENLRVIPINPRTIIVANGYPTLSSSGLTIYLMPTFNFMPGDVIKIDNAYIDISQRSKSDIESEQYIGALLDEKGEYMIYQIDYNLTNRGSSFSLRLLCKKRHLLNTEAKS